MRSFKQNAYIYQSIKCNTILTKLLPVFSYCMNHQLIQMLLFLRKKNQNNQIRHIYALQKSGDVSDASIIT